MSGSWTCWSSTSTSPAGSCRTVADYRDPLASVHRPRVFGVWGLFALKRAPATRSCSELLHSCSLTPVQRFQSRRWSCGPSRHRATSPSLETQYSHSVFFKSLHSLIVHICICNIQTVFFLLHIFPYWFRHLTKEDSNIYILLTWSNVFYSQFESDDAMTKYKYIKHYIVHIYGFTQLWWFKMFYMSLLKQHSFVFLATKLFKTQYEVVGTNVFANRATPTFVWNCFSRVFKAHNSKSAPGWCSTFFSSYRPV